MRTTRASAMRTTRAAPLSLLPLLLGGYLATTTAIPLKYPSTLADLSSIVLTAKPLAGAAAASGHAAVATEDKQARRDTRRE